MSPSALTHIYLSPHLDDAVLSCGGRIYRQGQAGERVVVVTVCAGDPPNAALSPFAQGLHEKWSEAANLGPVEPRAVVAARRAEDLAAVARLGAQAIHLDVPDCIYRRDPVTGLHLYHTESSLFGKLHTDELSLIRHVAAQVSALLRGFGRHHLYAPLGIGNHVDHQLTRRAAEAAREIYAYVEDYPYAAIPGGASPPNMDPERALVPELTRLDPASLQAKIDAISQYLSQISSFWADVAVMAGMVRQFAERVGGDSPAERIWRTG